MPVTIEQMIPICYQPVLDTMLGGYSFIDPKLRCKHKHNKVRIMTLGAYVEVYNSSGTSKTYHIKQLSIPMYWTTEDNLRNPIESQRVRLVKNLLENALHSHDDLFLSKLKRGMNAIVSKDYKYKLGPVREIESGRFIAEIYTNVAFIDQPC